MENQICYNLSEYLYENDINTMTIVLKLDGRMMDERVLQQVGYIKLPEEWLEKQEYR